MADEGWVLLISDKRVGHFNLTSPNTEEKLVWISNGVWVPAVDVERLLQLERAVCCGEDGKTHLVKVFGCGRASKGQMKSRPKHEPRLKRQAKPKVKRTRRPRERQEEVKWQAPTIQ